MTLFAHPHRACPGGLLAFATALNSRENTVAKADEPLPQGKWWRLQKVSAYFARFVQLFEFYANWQVLAFDDNAADEFERLRRLKLRVGTMDLKIAAITLVNGATLLTRNLQGFGRVPGLRAEDWLAT